MREVIFEVIEALRFATVHTGGTEMFSRELIYAIPLPSTVLGALGVTAGIYLSGDVCKENILDIKTLAEKLKGNSLDLFTSSCDEPLLWGPLIRSRERYFFCVGNELISIDKLKHYVCAALEQNMTKKVEYYKRLKPLIRLGIKLTTQKIAEPGYMYKVNFYGYNLEQYPALLVYVANVMFKTTRGIVRLGGENRLVKFSIGEPSKELIQFLSNEGEYAVALTPILFYSEEEVKPGMTYGLEDVEDVYGIPTGKTTKIKVENIGLGFSEVCKKRRPLIQALPPGTTLKLKNKKTKAVGFLSHLGYGSLLKISL